MPPDFEAPFNAAVDLWNLMDPEIQLILTSLIQDSLEKEGGAAFYSVKDGRIFGYASDDMDYEINTNENGPMWMWVNPSLSDEKMAKIFRKLGPGLKELHLAKVNEAAERIVQSGGGEFVGDKGMMKLPKKDGGELRLHYPMFMFDHLKGISWGKLLQNNQEILKSLHETPEGAQIEDLLQTVPHDFQIKTLDEHWLE